MILIDANVWIYHLDEDLDEHGPVAARLPRLLENADPLIPALVQAEVVHYICRHLGAQASSVVDDLLATPGELVPLTPAVVAQAAALLMDLDGRGLGGRDACLLVHARQDDATVITHDRVLFEAARDVGLDAHDPVT